MTFGWKIIFRSWKRLELNLTYLKVCHFKTVRLKRRWFLTRLALSFCKSLKFTVFICDISAGSNVAFVTDVYFMWKKVIKKNYLCKIKINRGSIVQVLILILFSSRPSVVFSSLKLMVLLVWPQPWLLKPLVNDVWRTFSARGNAWPQRG